MGRRARRLKGWGGELDFCRRGGVQNQCRGRARLRGGEESSTSVGGEESKISVEGGLG